MIVAADGVEACTLFEANRDDIALVIIDALMPRMGGREAADRIRAQSKVPILFASGYTAGTLPDPSPSATQSSSSPNPTNSKPSSPKSAKCSAKRLLIGPGLPASDFS